MSHNFDMSLDLTILFLLQNLFIECPVCGIVYGEKIGNQPNGAMSWTIISKCLPGHEGQNTIQIVYE